MVITRYTTKNVEVTITKLVQDRNKRFETELIVMNILSICMNRPAYRVSTLCYYMGEEIRFGHGRLDI